MDTKTFGNWLKNERLTREMTITAFSLKIGVSRPFLSQLENGSRSPSLDVIVKISNTLVVPLYDVIEMLGYQVLKDNEHVIMKSEITLLKYKIEIMKKHLDSMVETLYI